MKKKRSIKDKLSPHEAQPPAHIWEAIAMALDNKEQLTLKEKLYQYEEAPPVFAWNNIAHALPVSTPVIPIYKRYATPLKYIAAAVLIIITALVIYLLNDDKELPKATVRHAVIHHPKKAAAPASSTHTTQPQTISETNTAPTYSSNQLSVSRKKIIRRTIPKTYIPKLSASTHIIAGRILIKHDTPIVNSSIVNKYMVYSKEGKAVRISKKVYSWVDCASTINPAACSQKITQLQTQLANGTAMPASDFTGILAMLQQLNNLP